jgi:Ca2+-binding EF-hand superfamily protein
VFEAYDKDGNGVLDAAELDTYLSVYFDGTFVRQRDPRLKNIDKNKLFKHVHDNMDKDRNGLLSFEEIHALISGELDFKKVTEH